MRYGRVGTTVGGAWARLRDDGSAEILDRPPYEPDSGTVDSMAVDQVHLVVPAQPGKILAVGRNFAAHADEMGYARGAVPSVFVKLNSGLIGPGDEVVLPDPQVTREVELEAELAVMIGRRCRNVSVDHALDYVFGYSCADDVSARDVMKSDAHITRGKNFDTFCPLGPWWETDVDPVNVDIECAVNGEVRQSGNTRDHIFTAADIIAWLSSWTTLEAGDVLLTGSPGGRSALRDGDCVEITIESIGTLTHRASSVAPVHPDLGYAK